MKIGALLLCIMATCMICGCELPTEEDRNKAAIEAFEKSVDAAIVDHGEGIYYINSLNGDIAAAAMAKLKAQHPGQKMEKLEQKGRVGGHSITGTGAVSATVGWIIEFH